MVFLGIVTALSFPLGQTSLEFSIYKYENVEFIEGFMMENGVFVSPINESNIKATMTERVLAKIDYYINKYNLKLTDVFIYLDGEIVRDIKGDHCCEGITFVFAQHYKGIEILQFGFVIKVENGKIYIERGLVDVQNCLEKIENPIGKKNALEILDKKGVFKKPEEMKSFSEDNLTLVFFLGEESKTLEPYWLIKDRGDEEMFASMLISIKTGRLIGTH